MKEYLIDEKVYVDVTGAAETLCKAVGTIRNMISMKNFPPGIRKNRKLYFEKSEIDKFKKQLEVVEIKKS